LSDCHTGRAQTILNKNVIPQWLPTK